jgi:predicted dehydrogenase
VPTSYVGGLRLESGLLASLLMSFDVRGSTMPPLEIYGNEGTLRLKFPGHYRGSVLFGTEHDAITEEIEPGWRTYPMEATKIRGLGVEEFARALRTGEPSRVEGIFALHILEAMEAIASSAETGTPRRLTTRAARPAPYDPRQNPRNQILG